ncbi:hypothetical protein GDO78_011441 [Eleutherodactylus coqui]|uniref:HAUS augmin-like complex subunit 5 n=5 Tax=Eleutherodactylus coqui TaxID=57060 RepID=A0A8J6F821_ELECQ|nr:hypothetical protein GDO78_011441 [Eleutherodactylus coqui]
MERRGLAQELRRWALEEMNIPHLKAPTEDMLQRLFIGQCADIWRYAVRHVRSQRTVKNIEGNLLWYQQLQYSQAQRTLEKEQQQRRKRLCQEIQELRSELQHLQEQIQSTEREIVGQEMSNYKSHDLRRRSLLLQVYNKKSEGGCEALRENNLRIQKRCEQLQEISRALQTEPVFPALDVSSASSTFPEPEVLREVREVCQSRIKFWTSIHEGTISGSMLSGGEDLLSMSHKQWLAMSEKLWNSRPAKHILSSLEHLALESTQEMKKLQASLGAEPAETSCSVRQATRSGHETRGNTEESKRARSLDDDSLDVLPSFSCLIQEGWAQSVHVTSELRSIQHQSEELAAHLAYQIQEVHRMLSDDSELSAARRAAFDAELRLVLLRGCRNALFHECQILHAEAAHGKQEMKFLQQQQQNVQDLRLLLERNQKQIQVLIKGNSAFKAELQRSGSEVQQFVQEQLIPRHQELAHESQRLKDFAMKDAEHFRTVSLHALRTVSVEGNLVPAQDLSVNRLSDRLSPYSGIYERIFSVIRLPLYKAPEMVLTHVAEMKRQQLFLRSLLYNRNQAVTRVQQQICESQDPDLDTLFERLSAHYAHQVDHLVPKVEQLVQQCEKAQEYQKEVQAAVIDWWDQPAQYCLSWEQRGGQTLLQWRDRWTVASAAVQRTSGTRT